MNEIFDLVEEYKAIDDKDSLYARVLMSHIAECEVRLRCELARQIELTTRSGKHLAQVKPFARTAALERLAEIYQQYRADRSESG